MPEPVVLWTDPFTVNFGNTTGTQILASPAGLADGRFIIAWVDDTNNVDSDLGTDIIAQYFDPTGGFDGQPFRLNDFGFLRQETDPELKALASGGFVVAYEQNSNLGDTDILYERYDENGNQVDEGAAALGAAGASQVRNPTIGTRNLGEYSIVFDRTDLGDTDIRAVTVLTNGSMTAEFDAGQNSADFDRRPDTAMNGIGALVTVYEEEDFGATSIEYHSRNLNGAFLTQGQLTFGADPHIAALSQNSTFVVTWTQNGGGIYGRLLDAIGDPSAPTFTVADLSSDNEISSDVVGLEDGGFFVVWYDTNDDRIEGKRFDSSGSQVGGQITIENGASLARPELSLMSDGRVLVSWEDSGDIRAAIVDPRDDLVTGTNGNDALTSRPDGATVDAYGGNDTLYSLGAIGGLDTLNGWSGDDTADFSAFESGVWVGLNYAGVEAWTQDDSDATDAPTTSSPWRAFANLNSIENVTGTAANDLIYGDSDDNVLRGLAGDDDLRGGLGSDILYGGADNDRLRLSESAPSDFDWLNGEGGSDTADFSGFDSAVWANLDYSGDEVWTQDDASVNDGTGIWRSIADLTSIEHLVGTQYSDALIGDFASNTFAYVASGAGAGGLDIIDGGPGGSDTVDFSGAGFGVWADLLFPGIEAWTQDDGDATDTSTTWRTIADLSNIDHLGATVFSDDLAGDNNANRFTFASAGAGSGGFDEYYGRGGIDTVDFSDGDFGVWVDLQSSGVEAWTQDDINATDSSGTWRTIAELSAIERVVGSGFSDLLAGDTANNVFTGNGGENIFRFRDNFGNDQIVDFQDSILGFNDRIDFSLHSTVNSFADISVGGAIGGGTIITADGGTIWLNDTFHGSIDATDFIF